MSQLEMLNPDLSLAKEEVRKTKAKIETTVACKDLLYFIGLCMVAFIFGVPFLGETLSLSLTEVYIPRDLVDYFLSKSLGGNPFFNNQYTEMIEMISGPFGKLLAYMLILVGILRRSIFPIILAVLFGIFVMNIEAFLAPPQVTQINTYIQSDMSVAEVHTAIATTVNNDPKQMQNVDFIVGQVILTRYFNNKYESKRNQTLVQLTPIYQRMNGQIDLHPKSIIPFAAIEYFVNETLVTPEVKNYYEKRKSLIEKMSAYIDPVKYSIWVVALLWVLLMIYKHKLEAFIRLAKERFGEQIVYEAPKSDEADKELKEKEGAV